MSGGALEVSPEHHNGNEEGAIIGDIGTTTVTPTSTTINSGMKLAFDFPDISLGNMLPDVNIDDDDILPIVGVVVAGVVLLALIRAKVK